MERRTLHRTSPPEGSPERRPDTAGAESPHVDGPSEPSERTAFPIVGIGASAGGLEAFSQLLSELPADTGIAFVLVQHLDPRHESQLSDVLARTAAMPVITVTDGLQVEPDHVYVIPPNADMTIGGGDVTEAKRAEATRAALVREQAARAEAEAATRSKDAFLAILSHELRTPLTAMLGWTRMLRTQRLDQATAARGLEVIERNIRLQARFIEDLLDVSRIIAGNLSLDARPVMVAPAVEAALAAMRGAADAKGIQLDSVLDETAGPVRGDPARLQQIVWNFLSNAIKFTSSGGRVEIRLARRGPAVELSVRDTGKGLDAQQLSQIFTGAAVTHSSRRPQGGLGLGLTIVRHLVELHGGALHAESAGPGQGATFTVALPVSDELPAGEVDAVGIAARAQASGRLPALNGIRVLVVDDEADARELMRAVLAQCGAEVTVAATAGAVLEALEQARFDVLVSDIAMPEDDGYDLIRSVRARDAERGGRIPALALTAYARIEDRAAAISAGYQQHAAKPIEPAELAAAVAALAGRADQKRGG